MPDATGQPKVERRLAAILAADVVGYSRLMGMDEEGTLARLKAYRREIIDPKIAEHHGRIVKLTGDGALVEFPSVVEAVRCAAEIQQKMVEGNPDVPKVERIELRVGITLGDIIIEANDIYGDGVNIAARLEGIAEAGGICISGKVFEEIQGKLDLAFDYIGEHHLKNIAQPVRVYQVRLDGVATKARPALALPDKPSIAVLPFQNLSSDQEQDFFAEGITEDLITALSRIRELFVISRNSSFVYKGRANRPNDIARELGVRFILEGSVRVAGNRVRVTAELIDVLSGNHVWAERFDGGLDDIFAVQDEITRGIALALQVKLTYGELARLWEGQTQKLRAWEKMVLARDLFLRFNAIDNREARRILQEALGIDPTYTGAMVQLGLTYWWDARFNISVDKGHSLELAQQQVERVLGLNPEMGSAYMLQGGIAFLRDQDEEAVKLCRKGIDVAPGDSWAQAYFGLVCIYAGDPAAAVVALRTAIRLSPHHPTWYTYNLALANLWIGNFTAAQEAAEVYMRQEPDEPYAYTNLALSMAFSSEETMPPVL
jgi:TolB-like protein